MSSETSSYDRLDDIEAGMRQSLGLNTTASTTPPPSSPSDPLRGARQAIRSQAAAREYAERQLAHAEATIQDLRIKLHHSRRDKDAAVEAARSATARKVNVERSLIATESGLAAEKVARDRSDRALRESQATVSHLRTKLDAATQGLETAKAELAAERQARQKAENALREAKAAPQSAAPAGHNDAAVSPVCNSTEAVAVQPAREPSCLVEASEATVPPTSAEECVISTTRRPTRRQRKTEPMPPVRGSTRKAQAATKAISPKVRSTTGKTLMRSANDQAPVQWWVEGWNRRGA